MLSFQVFGHKVHCQNQCVMVADHMRPFKRGICVFTDGQTKQYHKRKEVIVDTRERENTREIIHVRA